MQDLSGRSIAWIGTGTMGGLMATRLLDARASLTVWNRTSERAAPLVGKGAKFANSAAEAVRHAHFVVVMVEGDSASQAVWNGKDGVFAGLRPDAIAIDCSTLSPVRTQALTERAGRLGMRFVAAPVSGSLPQAEAGTLMFLAGGAERDIEEAGIVLRHLGKGVHDLGSPPLASLSKLAVNGMLACQVVAAAEACGFLERAGLSLDAVSKLLAQTPVASPITMATLRQIAAGNYDPLFPISMALKDLEYLASASDHLGTSLPMTNCAQDLLDRARPWKSQNISAVAKLFSPSLPVERIRK